MVKSLFIFLIFSFVHTAFGQTPFPVDMLAFARSIAYKKNFAEADRLLSRFTSTKNEVNALRLHARVLYWMKEN
ncbi:hypothetical protein A6C57_02085 [Fibrella sp. ES10-3-2-2]|nr:hypothetical protein A6C57_02085 [Fibrella sp. ES10-3-2-2]